MQELREAKSGKGLQGDIKYLKALRQLLPNKILRHLETGKVTHLEL
jgi:hypothetical protein